MYGRVEQHQGCYSEWSFNGVSTCTVVLNSIKAALEQIGWTRIHKLEPRGAKLIWVDNWRQLGLVDFKEG